MEESKEIIKFVFDWSTLIACLAFFVAVHQAWISRKHNKLSVQPLIYDFMDEGDKCFTYSIRNKGHGVAKVKSFKFFWAGLEITDEELRGKIKPYIKHKDHFKITNLGSDFGMSNDEIFKLIDLTVVSDGLSDIPTDRFKKIINLIVTNCRVKIKYKSLYNEEFSFETSTSAIDLSLYKVE